MSHRSAVTIRDVAARAGVSHQTVSRVINFSEQVSPETRMRVQAAIAELGYRPNAIARFMANGRTRTFACLSPNLTDYTFASIIEGIETEARQYGYFAISSSAPEPETFATLVEQLIASRRADGMLVLNPYIDQRWQFIPENVAAVLIGARARDEFAQSVSLDEENAGFIATQHLLALGHRQVALISGPESEDCTRGRLAGYQEAIHSAGLQTDPGLIRPGDWSVTSGYEIVKTWLFEGKTFTAIFAQNDRMAVGAIRALLEAGKRVPEDVSVIGFDDMPLASYFEPPLTTMRQDMHRMGREAVRLLLNAIEQPQIPPQQLRLYAELVVRSSTHNIQLKEVNEP